MKKIIPLIVLLALFCGCSSQNSNLIPLNNSVSCSSPYISYQGSCCLDTDQSNVCDYLENPTETTQTETVTTANQVTTTTFDYCSDGLMDNNETGIDCGGQCRPCKTPCDVLIQDFVQKPAARTSKLCLTNKEKTPYMNSTYTFVEEADSLLTLVAYDSNGTKKSVSLTEDKDVSFGNSVIRLIGRAKPAQTTYVQVYAWTVEGKIGCTLNSDCGEQKSTGTFCLNGNQIVNQFVSYSCTEPGTILSRCQAQQTNELLKTCANGMACTGDVECVPQECYNGLFDQDEDNFDCGGPCRPCSCFDKNMSGTEEGVDCGGECKPCEANQIINDSTPPKITIISPTNTLYRSEKIDLIMNVSEEADCSYSLNSAPRTIIGARRNATVYVNSSTKDLTVYCTDAAGNNATAKQNFTVSLFRSDVCPEDNVSAEYTRYFDEVSFYGDDESLLGATNRCGQETFDYAIAYLNDSSQHASISNATIEMSDKNLSISKASVIQFDCRNTGKLSVNYARLESNANMRASKNKIIIYFNETKPVSAPGSFWRIYAYGADGSSVDLSRYIDAPYDSTQSQCGKESNIQYQEIDITALTEKMISQNSVFRLGFYTSKLNSEITISEIETAAQAKDLPAAKPKK